MAIVKNWNGAWSLGGAKLPDLGVTEKLWGRDNPKF